MGLGTASSRILDYFGLSETEKDVVFTLVPEPCVGKILRLTAEKFQIHRPGQGILFHGAPVGGERPGAPGAVQKRISGPKTARRRRRTWSIPSSTP